MTSHRERTEYSLLHDDALVVRVDDELAQLVAAWLPLHAAPPRRKSEPRASIDVVVDASAAASDADVIGGAPLLRFAGVHVHELPGDGLRLVGFVGRARTDRSR